MRAISGELEKETNKLNEIITSYEKNLIGYSNDINQTFSNWNDETSKKLQETYSSEKKEIELTIQELKYLKNIYQEVVNSYKEIGDKIEYELEGKEQVKNLFASYKAQLDKIILLYQTINIESYTKKELLLKQSKELLRIKKEIQELEIEFQVITTKIENIEESVEKKLSNMIINKIEEVGEII